MDFGYQFDELQGRINQNQTDLQRLRDNFALCKEMTVTLLNKCAEKGYTRVSVGRAHKSIPFTKDWPFNCPGNVFAFSDKRDGSGWPAIWGIVSELGIGNGCGNSHQHQIKPDKVIDGVYHLKSGKWVKVD